MMTLQEAEDLFIGPSEPTDQSWLSPSINIPLMSGETYSYDPTAAGPYWEQPKDTSWLTSLTKPIADFGQVLFQGIGKSVEKQYETTIPDLLWGWGLERAGVIERPKKQVVAEGAGVNVIHTQPAHAGGEPATPITIPIPQLVAVPGAAGAPGEKSGTSILLIAGALILLFVLRK